MFKNMYKERSGCVQMWNIEPMKCCKLKPLQWMESQRGHFQQRMPSDRHAKGNTRPTDLLVDLLKEGDLFLQAFNAPFQVQPGQSGTVDILNTHKTQADN